MNIQKARQCFFCLIYGDEVGWTASVDFVMERLILKLTSIQANMLIDGDEV